MMQNIYFQILVITLPSEISATFAIEQIKKLKNNINIRNKNFDYLKKFFGNYMIYLIYLNNIKMLKHHG